MKFLHQWHDEEGCTSTSYPEDKQMNAEVMLNTLEGYLETSQVSPE